MHRQDSPTVFADETMPRKGFSLCRRMSSQRDHLTAASGIDVAAARWANACVTEIASVPGGGWLIARLACAVHLDGVGSLASAGVRPVSGSPVLGK